MSLDEQINRVKQQLESQSFDELLFSEQWARLDALLVHASRCQDKSLLEGETLDEPLDASQQLCEYPRCERGKVLYCHVFLCKRSVCLLCQSTLNLVKFHAVTCTDSSCTVPRCGECKEIRRRKEHRLRRNERNELRLRRLRRNEQRLRQLYMPESRQASAAAVVTVMSNASADDHVLQLAQLSVQDGSGDQSNRNDGNKLLGNRSSVSSILASRLRRSYDVKIVQLGTLDDDTFN